MNISVYLRDSVAKHLLNKFLTPICVSNNCSQKRWLAARRGKRIAANKEKQRLAKIRREEEKKKGPKVWSPKLRLDKSTLNIGQRRFSDKHLKDLNAIVDDVYEIELYKQMTFCIEEALQMHRETHHKTQLNEENAFIDAVVELNLHLKKKNRYLESFRGILAFPNKFEYKADRKVIAICKKESDQLASRDAGAVIVGGSEIIRMLQIGDLNVANFDDLVCHGDCLVELADIRGVLGSFFPTKQKGNLGFDMKKLVSQFVTGVEYELKKDEIEQDFGWVKTTFGRLNMENQHLEQNFKFLLANIEKQRPPLAPVPFISRVLLNSEPSKEKFAIKFWNYIEGYANPNGEEEDDTTASEELTKLTN